MTMKQPHEGIVPIPANRFPLELNDCNLPFRMMIRSLAAELNSATRLHPGSYYQDIHRRMEDPRPGDLVVEWSTSSRTDLDSTLGGFGVLLSKRIEWAMTDEEWANDVAGGEEHEMDRPTDTAWYVQYGPQPEHVFRWVGARCIALPVSLEDLMRAQKKWPQGKADS